MILLTSKIILRSAHHLLKTKSTKMSTGLIPTQKINVDGQTINYLRVGNGVKHLLCIPGAMGTIWSDFKPQIDNLDRNHFTVIVWDPPGYGESRPPGRKFGVDFYANDAKSAQKFMQAIGIDKYSLLGWSDGGIASMILAANCPRNVEKLVIWGVNSYISEADRRSFEKVKDISKWSDKVKAPLIEIYTEQGLKDIWNEWYETQLKIYENGGNICTDQLQCIKCPVFILHGDKDPLVDPEHPSFLLSKIKNVKLHRFPGGKHNIHLRYAEDFNNLVTTFLLQ